AGDLAVRERHDRRRCRVALSDQHVDRGRLPGRRHDPARGRDRLGRYLDAGDQGTASELRLQVDAVDYDTQGAGAAGRLLRRDASEQARVPDHGPASERRVRGLPRQRLGVVLQHDQVLEDTASPVRQWQEQLRAVPAMGVRLDADHRVKGGRSVTSTMPREGRPAPDRPSPGMAGRGSARISAALWRRTWLRATLTLSPPLAWFLVIYIASLLVMLVTAFWSVNPFTNALEHTWTLANFRELFTGTYLSIIGRTIAMAAIVTVTDAVLAFPVAYYMARIATQRGRQLLFTAVLLPLWASYIARVYAWIVILQKDGTLSWFFDKIGVGPVNIGYSNVAMWL